MTAYGERIKDIKVKWGQSAPFNDLLPEYSGVPYYNNGRAFVGCVPIAVAQFLSYHKRNFIDYIIYSDWLSFEANPYGADTKVKRLLEIIYSALDAKPSKDGTSSTIKRAKTFLTQNAFNVGEVCDFNFDKIYNSLSHSPVIIDGYPRNSNTGHTWILDGVKFEQWQVYDFYRREYKGELIEMKSGIGSYSFYYVRCNWGWNGSSDGWVECGVFNPSGNNYSYNNDIIPYNQ